MMEAGETRTVYSAGDYVIYAGNGICKIEDILSIKISAALGNDSTIL